LSKIEQAISLSYETTDINIVLDTKEKLKKTENTKWKLSYKAALATCGAVAIVIAESTILWTLVFTESNRMFIITNL